MDDTVTAEDYAKFAASSSVVSYVTSIGSYLRSASGLFAAACALKQPPLMAPRKLLDPR